MESIIFFNSHNYIYGSFCGNMQKNKQRKSKMKQYINNLKDYAELLYNQALLMEGFPLKDPVAFSNKMCELMIKSSK